MVVAAFVILDYDRVMADDARVKLQQRFAKIGAKALARLHALHPHLEGKSLNETVLLLKEEERHRKWGTHPLEKPSQPPDENRNS